MLRVRTPGAALPFATGFFIGARGEFVYGAGSAPPELLEVITADGKQRAAAPIGFDPALGLAVGRLLGAERDVLTEPLRVAERAPLALEQWVVTVRHDKGGEPEPFAGVVEESARARSIGQKPHRSKVLVAKIAAPSSRGSPVLSVRGELVAIAIEAGARKSRVVPIEALLPFLRTAILGP